MTHIGVHPDFKRAFSLLTRNLLRKVKILFLFSFNSVFRIFNSLTTARPLITSSTADIDLKLKSQVIKIATLDANSYINRSDCFKDCQCSQFRKDKIKLCLPNSLYPIYLQKTEKLILHLFVIDRRMLSSTNNSAAYIN